MKGQSKPHCASYVSLVEQSGQVPSKQWGRHSCSFISISVTSGSQMSTSWCKNVTSLLYSLHQVLWKHVGRKSEQPQTCLMSSITLRLNSQTCLLMFLHLCWFWLRTSCLCFRLSRSLNVCVIMFKGVSW